MYFLKTCCCLIHITNNLYLSTGDLRIDSADLANLLAPWAMSAQLQGANPGPLTAAVQASGITLTPR